MTGDRKRDEGGSVLVEFALVSTVLFGLFFGLVGISLVEIGNSVGTNSAREGARQATLAFRCADAQSPGGAPVAGCAPTAGPSDPYTAIVAKVKAKLVGLVRGVPAVTVQCLDGTVASPVPKPCDESIVPETDLVKVTVRWSHLTVTPFVPAASHTSSAVMVVVGSGSAGPTPLSCQVTSSGFGTGVPNPQTVTIAGAGASGTLTQTVAITANTTNACASLFVTYRNSTGSFTSAPAPMAGSQPSFTLTLPASTVWAADTYTIVFTDSTGSAVASVAPVLKLVVQSAAICAVGSTAAVPASVALAGAATVQGPLLSAVTITAQTTACPALLASFNTGTTFVTNLPMGAVGGGFSLIVPAAAYVWTTGLKIITFSTATNPSVGSATLSVSPGCGLRFEVDDGAGIRIDGIMLQSVKGSLSGPIVLKATPVSGLCQGTVVFSFDTGVTSETSSPVSQVGGAYSLTVAAGTYAWDVGTVTFSLTYGSNPIVANPTQDLVICKFNAKSCP